MNHSQTRALADETQALVEVQDKRLPLPEATMFIVASSGALWALLYGAFNALIG
ncbi:MAG: hypothetical protein AAGA73_05185 [Pseudomonadota bacterium]